MSAALFSTFTEVGLVDSRLRPGIIKLPLTTEIPLRSVTLKDIYGVANASTILIQTQVPDIFEDGTTSKILNTNYGNLSFYAGKPGSWYIINGTQQNSLAAVQLSTGTLNATRISTQQLFFSSINGFNDIVSSGNLLNFVSTSYLQSQLASTVTGLGTAGYVSSTQLGSTTVGLYNALSNWSIYPATNGITLASNAPTITNPSTLTLTFVTDNTSFIDSNSKASGINLASATFNGPSSQTYYTLIGEPIVTGQISSFSLVYAGNTLQTGSFYLSTLWLGNVGGTLAGQLTTDPTATDLYWKGTKLALGTTGVTEPNLTSTVTGLGTIGYISSSQLTSTTIGLTSSIRQWANYPALSSIVFANEDINIPNKIITNNGILQLQADQGVLVLNSQNIAKAFATSRVDVIDSFPSGYSHSMTAGSAYTGEVSTATFLDYTDNVASLYLSTLFLGNTGGTRYGEITVNTTSRILFNGQALAFNSTVFSTTSGLTNNTLPPSFTSTVQGLGTVGYISSSQLTSTTAGIYNVINAGTAVTSNNLTSTVIGLGTAGYISSPQLGSTTQGLLTSGQNNLVSSVIGLGTANYISSPQLGSTTQGLLTLGQNNLVSSVIGLGTANYISSQQLGSTTQGLLTLGQNNLVSSVIGLGTAGYISSQQLGSTTQGLLTSGQNNLVSSVIGLGTAGYISSTQLTSTTAGLYTAINAGSGVTSNQLVSSIEGLGTAGYISSTQLGSTTQGLITFEKNNLTSTVGGLGEVGYISTTNGGVFTLTPDSPQNIQFNPMVNSITKIANSGANDRIITQEQYPFITASFQTNFRPPANQIIGIENDFIFLFNSSGNVEAWTFYPFGGLVANFGAYNSNNTYGIQVTPNNIYWYVNNTVAYQIDAAAIFKNYYFKFELININDSVSNISFGGTSVPRNAISSFLYLNTPTPLSFEPLFTSTVTGLGTATYISSPQLISTTAGLYTAFGSGITNAQLVSSIGGLGTAGYISSTQLTSTTTGLYNAFGTGSGITNAQLVSSIGGLGTAGYISTSQLTSTVGGLVENFELTSTVRGLGTAGYISTINNGIIINNLSTLNISSGSGVFSSLIVGPSSITDARLEVFTTVANNDNMFRIGDPNGQLRMTAGLNYGGIRYTETTGGLRGPQLYFGRAGLGINNVANLTPATTLDVIGQIRASTMSTTFLFASNVGVNTATATYPVDVVGITRLQSTFIQNNSITSSNGTGRDYIAADIGLFGGTTTAGNPLADGYPFYGPHIRSVIPNNQFQDVMRLDFTTGRGGNDNTQVPRVSILSGAAGQGGFVGINTSSPTTTLDVRGQIRASTMSTTAFFASSIGVNTSGTTPYQLNVNGAVGFTNVNNTGYGQLKLFPNALGGETAIAFYSTVTEINAYAWLMGRSPNFGTVANFGIAPISNAGVFANLGTYFTSNGNVGINCNAPSYALDVNGGANLQNGNLFISTINGLIVQYAGGAAYIRTNTAGFPGAPIYMGTGGSNYHVFSGGQVGISTVTVGANIVLDVNGIARTRIIISTLTTNPTFAANSYGQYFNLSNTGITGATLPSLTNSDNGWYVVMRNNTPVTLNMTWSGTTTGLPASSNIISASNSLTLAWNGSAYIYY